MSFLFMNQKKGRSRKKNPFSKLARFFTLPFLRICPPQQDDFQTSQLDQQERQNSQPVFHSGYLPTILQPPMLKETFRMPEIPSQLISIEKSLKQTLFEITMEEGIIGVIGQLTEAQMSLFENSQIIEIGDASELPSLRNARQFSFSHVFITNKFVQYSPQTFFSFDQTLSIRLETEEELLEVIMRYEEYLKQKYSSSLLKKYYEKFKADIAIIEGSYWLTLNQNLHGQSFEDFISTRFNLTRLTHQNLIQDLSQYLSVSSYAELLKVKEHIPHQFNPRYIHSYIEQKVNGCKKIQSTNYETTEYYNQMQIIERKISSSEEDILSLDIFQPLVQEVRVKHCPSIVHASSLKRQRSRSEGVCEEVFREELDRINNQILDEMPKKS